MSKIVMCYVCVNCGNEMTDLYKQYSPSVLKLTNCTSCRRVADKYIEYDPVIVVIDLLLLNQEAYRHILYNTGFQNHWKLAVVLLLVEAYAEWTSVQGRSSDALSPSSHWFQGEEQFYFTCIYSVLGCGMFFSLVAAVTSARWWLLPAHKPPTYSFLVLWKGIVLGSFCRFLFIPSLIWGQVGSWHHVFITGYTLLAQLRAYSVVITLGIALKSLETHQVTSWVLGTAQSCLCHGSSSAGNHSGSCLA
ncbi:protein ARV1 isoform X2 [Bacillus rossius redtenbacheri]|uniref:protein ARV1 isoform X2 n=1 Tax=Bacillus rossius redtenbacheri TaxID=93214 RepID=UPI002FDCD333